MKHHNNETVSIIRSEAIINCDYTLEISGIKCLLPYKNPIRHFIINLFMAKLILNTVIRQIVFSLHVLNCSLPTPILDQVLMTRRSQGHKRVTFLLSSYLAWCSLNRFLCNSKTICRSPASINSITK